MPSLRHDGDKQKYRCGSEERNDDRGGRKVSGGIGKQNKVPDGCHTGDHSEKDSDARLVAVVPYLLEREAQGHRQHGCHRDAVVRMVDTAHEAEGEVRHDETS